MRLIALLITLAALHSSAQTNETYPFLQCEDGTTYTNLQVKRVTPTHLIVYYDGGGGRIALSNLSVILQNKYHYDPAAVAAAQARQAGLLDVSQVLRPRPPSPPAVKIHLVRRTGIGQYLVDVTRDAMQQQEEMQIRGLPLETESFMERLQGLRDTTPVMVNVNGLLADSQAAVVANNNDRLAQIKQLEAVELSKTIIMAVPTGERYAGMEIWRYAGKPTVVTRARTIRVTAEQSVPEPDASHASEGVPADVFAGIRAEAEDKWPGNFDMQESEINRQCSAWHRLNP